MAKKTHDGERFFYLTQEGRDGADAWQPKQRS